MRQCKRSRGGEHSGKHAGLIFVAAHPKHLKALRPAPPRKKSTPERLWRLPLALEKLSEAHDFFQKDVVKAAGVDQSTVSRWLAYKGLEGIAAASLLAAEDGLKLPPGSLLPAGITLSDPGVPKLAEAMGLSDDLLVELQSNEVGERMNSLREEVRKAVLGVAHVYGITLEHSVTLAHRLVQKHRFSAAKSKELGAPFWFEQIRGSIEKKSDESGTHPSAGKISIVPSTD
jgi:transcriptional regulator with XRE-family HTH domain